MNVTDLSHPQFYAQRANVQHVLEQLRLTQGQLNAVITVLNKADKVYVKCMYTTAATLGRHFSPNLLSGSLALPYIKKIWESGDKMIFLPRRA